MDLASLKALDALLRNNQYEDDVFEKILPYVTSYFDTVAQLRSIPLGEVKSALVMLAGGRR